MTERVRFTRTQMRSMAKIAKEEGVSVTLKPDGSLSVLPASAASETRPADNPNMIVRL